MRNEPTMRYYTNALSAKENNRRLTLIREPEGDGVIVDIRIKDDDPSDRAMESNRLGMHRMGFRLSKRGAMILHDLLIEYFRKIDPQCKEEKP